MDQDWKLTTQGSRGEENFSFPSLEQASSAHSTTLREERSVPTTIAALSWTTSEKGEQK